MGMTINESINQIINSLMGKKANLLNHSDRVALTNALNTMRKYQKIQEIMSKRPKDMIRSNPTLRAISEVLEDGNNYI